MRAVGVVAPAPALDVELRIAEREKPVLIQALVAQPTVEAFDVTVLNRFAGLNEQQLDAVIRRPRIERATPKLAAIVEREAHRLAARRDHGVQRGDDATLGKLCATVIVKLSRVQLSITVKQRKRRPADS